MAVAVVVAAGIVRIALTPLLGPTRLPFITFFPAIVLAAWYGGLGPGLVALILAALASSWFFLLPLRSFELSEPVAFLAFLVSAGFILAAIEAMHRARRDLVRARDMLATTLRSIGDGVVVTDFHGNVSFLNPEAERLTGWKTNEASGKPLSEVFRIVNEQTRDIVENPVHKVLESGTVVGLANHTLLIARDGSETPIDDIAAPVTEPGQPVSGVVLVFRDVREQRVAVAARARLAAIVEASGDAIISEDVDGTVLTWNAAAEELFGYRSDEIIGRSIATVVPPELRKEEEDIIRRIRDGLGSQLIETVRLAKDGRRIPVSVQVSPLHNSEGEIIGASKIIRDLSGLVAMRDALAREKDLLATTLSSIGDGVIITDAEGTVTFVNPVAENLTDWTLSDAVGRRLLDVFQIVNETTRAEVENPALRAMREGAIMGLANHTVLIARDGTERAIDDSAAPIRDRQGHIVGSVLVFRDVTARRYTETTLERAEEHSRSVVAHMVDGIIAIDESGRISAFNQAAEKLFGYRADEIIGQNVKVLMPEPYHREHDGYLRNYVRTGTAKIIGIGREVVGQRKDRSTFPMALAVSEFMVGNTRHFTGIVRDLTERRRMEGEHERLRAELAAKVQELQTIFEIAPVQIWFGDAECKTFFGNRRAYEEHGLKYGINASFDAPVPELPPGLRFEVNGRTLQSDEMPMQLAARTGKPVHAFEHDVVRPDGERRTMWANVSPLLDDGGKVRGVVGAYIDVTSLRAAERALREADQRKNEFLAILAHELRNPLAPIKNSITLLQLKGPPDPELARARGVIDRQVQQISRLLDDLLDVNRLDRRKLELRKEAVALTTVIESAMETARPGIESRRHRVSMEVPADVVVDADPLRLAQVFANLLNNAAKYMDEGGQVRVQGWRDGDSVYVSVKDSGVGIAAESLPRIFEMFSQVPLPLERAQGGVGIGLSLAKGLVELHGGTITAHSEGIGRGSEFLVRLPVIPGAPIPEARRTGERLPRKGALSRRILIADDVRDNADTLALMLRALDHTVEVAYDGAEAVAAAERFRPDVALLDIAMPGMNGLDACRLIRAETWGKSIYLIAQTGWGQDEDRRRALEAGFNHHMLKPVDAPTLVLVLANLPN